MPRRTIKILTSPTISGLSADIESEMHNGYNIVTNSAPALTGSNPSDLVWISTMEAGEFSYNELSDLPTLEGITLSGAMTYDYLGVQPSGDYATNSDLALKLAPSNLIAGENISLTVAGMDVTIKAIVDQNYVTTETFLSGLSTLENNVASNYVLNSTFLSAVSTIEGEISSLGIDISNVADDLSSNYVTEFRFLTTVYGIEGNITQIENDLSNNYVPYTGALSSVDLGTKSLSSKELWVDATTWTARTDVGLIYGKSVVSSSDGTKLAACVENGYIYTSTDSGITWIAQTNSGIRDWTGIATSDDGTRLAACLYGYIYISTDSGATWAQLVTAPNDNWEFITSSADGSILCGYNNNTYGTVMISRNYGVDWDYGIVSEPFKTFTGLAMSSDGTKIVVCESPSGYIYTSTDTGATWTTQTHDGPRNWSGIASSADGINLLACTSSDPGCVYTSTDSGVSFTIRNTAGYGNYSFVASSSDGSILVTVKDYIIYISTDSGVTWTAQTNAGSRDWRSVAMSSDGVKLAAVGYNEYIYTSIQGGSYTLKQESDGAFSHSYKKDIIFKASDSFTERMRIDSSSGFIGIGTDAPTEKLHVVGNGLFTDNVSATNIYNILTVSNSAQIQDLYIMNEDNVHYHLLRIRTDGLDNNLVIGSPVTLGAPVII
jgi:photosystem II stability/assembly factor-like uncharacterized protein